MHTVIETESFLRDAKVAGLSDKERTDIVNFIAYNQTQGMRLRAQEVHERYDLQGREKERVADIGL